MQRLPAYPANRLTDRARTVLRLARKTIPGQKVNDLTPRSLLIGMCLEGTGVASRVLAHHGVDEQSICDNVDASLAVTGWSITQFSKTCQNEATSIGHDFIGTEHLLIALTSPHELAANNALIACGLSPQKLREETLGLLEGRGFRKD